jgi:hypothetical protein
MNKLPALLPNEGSYMIIRKSDGSAVLEIFRNSKNIEIMASCLKPEYKFVGILEYLSSLNKESE